MKDSYNTLKLPRSASQEDIKKAYRKLSYKYHPDRGGSLHDFRNIISAYEELSNNRSKSYSITINRHYPKEDNKKQKCKSITEIVNLSLEKIYKKEKIIKDIKVDSICYMCHGIGFKEKIENCEKCEGLGCYKDDVCSECSGQGYIILSKKTCLKCDGNKIIKRNKRFEIRLRGNIYNGKKIYYKGCGNENFNYKRGDILFIIKIEKHPIFKLTKNNNLYMKQNINIVDALSGFVFRIEHLDGRKLFADIQHVIKPNMRIKIINEGLRKNKSNLIVEFKVIFPSQIINYIEKKELEKMTMMYRSDINIDTNEYEHCHIVSDFDFKKNNETSIELSE
jgi:DnaJ-class molecular chaperone